MTTTTRNQAARKATTDTSRTVQQSIGDSIRYYQKHKNQIPQRLHELDQEWDIERAIAAHAAAATLFGLTWGLLGRSRWFLLPATAAGFLLQHATQGWCAPVSVLQRLGYRSAFEIDTERQALKLIRGDYKKATADDADADDIVDAVQA